MSPGDRDPARWSKAGGPCNSPPARQCTGIYVSIKATSPLNLASNFILYIFSFSGRTRTLRIASYTNHQTESLKRAYLPSPGRHSSSISLTWRKIINAFGVLSWLHLTNYPRHITSDAPPLKCDLPTCHPLAHIILKALPVGVQDGKSGSAISLSHRIRSEHLEVHLWISEYDLLMRQEHLICANTHALKCWSQAK